jgi:hypothetical protein
MQNAALKEGVAIFSTTDNQFSVSCAVGELL